MSHRGEGADASGDERADEPPSTRLDGVRDLYDDWSRYYDWNPLLALVRPVRARVVEAMALSPGDRVVDMGTGTGANLGPLREAVGPSGTVVGVDASPGMLSKARRRIDRHDWANVAVVEGDVRAPPIEGPVDAVVSSFLVVMYDDVGPLFDAWMGDLGAATVANLYAGPSDRWYGAVPNALLALYLRVFEGGWLADDRSATPSAVVAERGRHAREALAERASSLHHETHLFGLAHADVGRV